MIPFHLYAFIPFGVLLSTGLVAIAISLFVSLAPRRAIRDPALARSAEILYFPLSRQNQHETIAAKRQPAPRAVYARTPLAG